MTAPTDGPVPSQVGTTIAPSDCADLAGQTERSGWAIETEGLRKVYGRFVALDDLTLRVAHGEVFGFLGPNGAGKTTALKILLGLAAATSGSARVLNRPVGDRAARRHVGYLPEHFRFPDWLTGSEFVDVHGRLAGLSRTERRERVPQALATVGLTGAADKQLRTYSKGMQQRVGLAQAIVHRPTLVFLDEPTSALDPLGRRDVRNLISRLRDEGATVFLNSHLLSEVELVCDRVAIVNHGRVVRSGALADLLAGEHVLRLTVDSATAELVAALRAWGAVERLDERVTTPEAQGGRSPLALPVRQELRIITSGPEVAPAVAAAVVAQGRQLFALVPEQHSLEEVFLGALGAAGDAEGATP